MIRYVLGKHHVVVATTTMVMILSEDAEHLDYFMYRKTSEP